MPIFGDMNDSPIVRAFDRACMRSARLAGARDRIMGAWDWIAENETRRRRAFVSGGIGAGIVAIAIGAGAYLALRPMPKPDYENDSIYRVFKYTMLTDEFNKLPIEERLRLIGMIRERLENLDKSESVLLAAFASGIAGKTREQLEENISRLLIDTWDMHATEYADVPLEDREAFLDGVFIQLHEMGETLERGEVGERTPEERLAEGRSQAQRDREMMKDGEGPSSRALSRLYRILDDGIGGHASPQERVRGQLLMRDMTRRLRGEPLSGGG